MLMSGIFGLGANRCGVIIRVERVAIIQPWSPRPALAINRGIAGQRLNLPVRVIAANREPTLEKPVICPNNLLPSISVERQTDQKHGCRYPNLLVRSDTRVN